MSEIWKEIPGYEKLYQASSLGRIRSILKRTSHGTYTVKSTVLKQQPWKDYLKVALCNPKKIFYVHQLIAMAFKNHIPNGHTLVINHINSIKRDNKPENLEIVTALVNSTECRTRHADEYTSKFVGVSFDGTRNKWVARLKLDGRYKYLGRFNTEMEAKNECDKYRC